MRHTWTLIVVVLSLGWLGFRSPTPDVHAQNQPEVAAFTDDFETTTPNWKIFEELVGGNPCYATGLGMAERTTVLAFSGQQSLSVWANGQRGDKSNHLIAYTTFVPTDVGGLWRYRVRLLIPIATSGFGQTGPEFALQNTRLGSDGQWTTATAGVQYIANSYMPDVGGWHLWIATAPGRANWSDTVLAPLSPGQWYTATLDVDYGTNHYLGFGLTGPATNLYVSLKTYQIAEEVKGFVEPSFVLTLESENMWNNCQAGVVFDYQVLYDKVEASHRHLLLLPIVFGGTFAS